MNWGSWLLWGFVGTVVLTTVMAGSQGLRLTRMSMPYMLGTMVTPNRDRAKVFGFGRSPAQRLGVLAAVRRSVPHRGARATWWNGAAIGARARGVRARRRDAVLPGIHPRMASEKQGPTVMRQLEPPGFLALNYGFQTPLSVLIAHLAFGVILGSFYTVAKG